VKDRGDASPPRPRALSPSDLATLAYLGALLSQYPSPFDALLALARSGRTRVVAPSRESPKDGSSPTTTGGCERDHEPR